MFVYFVSTKTEQTRKEDTGNYFSLFFVLVISQGLRQRASEAGANEKMRLGKRGSQRRGSGGGGEGLFGGVWGGDAILFFITHARSWG